MKRKKLIFRMKRELKFVIYPYGATEPRKTTVIAILLSQSELRYLHFKMISIF